MKIKYFAIFLALLIMFLSAAAQQNKLQFHSINSVGTSFGQTQTSILLQNINGFKYKHFYSGIGFGADYYQHNSFPLFIDARGYFGKNDKAFAYGDLGYNFSGKDKPGKEIYYYNSYHFSGGVYTDIGIGYKFKITNKTSFVVSSGFTYKEIYNKVGLSYPCYRQEACPVDYQNYKYGNGRVVLKASVDF